MTIGEPISAKIQPLVDRWRETAAAEKGTLGIGGDWLAADQLSQGQRVEEDSRQRAIRGKGQLAGGAEEEIRKEIVAVLQEEVRKLGDRVERREGRFERGEWTQSRKMGEGPPDGSKGRLCR
jgi:monolysocardiolipin acyltransferase